MKYPFVPALLGPALLGPALLGLAMAGCTSSEPQGIAGAAPAASSFADTPAAPAYGQQPAFTAPAPAAAMAAPMQTTTAAGFPPPPDCDPGSDCTAPRRVEKCRTVGSVTTCDVPPDPAADRTRYTN